MQSFFPRRKKIINSGQNHFLLLQKQYFLVQVSARFQPGLNLNDRNLNSKFCEELILTYPLFYFIVLD